MKRLSCRSIALAALVALAAGPAMAADMGRPAPAYTKAPMMAPAYSWTGFYFGGNVGGASGSFDPTTTLGFSPIGWFNVTSTPAVTAAGQQSIKPTGFIGGGQIGYNWQSGMFVLGLEADFQSFHLSGNAASAGVYPCCAPTVFNVTSSANTNWLFTARPRLGIASNNWLFYATGGLAVTDLHGNFGFTDNCAANPGSCGGGNANEAVSITSTKAGYAVGGGIEAGLWGNWSVKAEYLYVNFGTITGTGFLNPPVGGSNNNPFTHSIDLKANIGRVGLNYRL
jgi:outer membrane immunogenic protein